MNVVFDSSALIALMRNETGGETVAKLIGDAGAQRYVHAINLCEVYYDFLRVADNATAIQVIEDIIATGIIVREDLDAEFWRDAGFHKGTQRRISLADCLCIALARRISGEVITADRGEFAPIANKGICSVRFIR